MKPAPRLAILYQHMSPTRVPVFDALAKKLGDSMKVFYPAVLEGDREKSWTSGGAHHQHVVLKRRSFSYELFSMKRFVHVNPDIIARLREFNPDVVAIWTFSPTMLMAWMYAMVRRKTFIVATDGCLRSDRHNTPLHPLIRKVVIPTAHACIGSSANSQELFVKYGAKPEAYFNCWLAADNERFAPFRAAPRNFDVMFSGQFIDRKLPHFFVDVVAALQKLRSDVTALLIGSGPLRDEVLARLDALGVRYEAPGFLSRDALPRAYGSARLLLFPTRLDAYGVIANEALAAGTPVVANEEPGAVGEVILDGATGMVLPLNAQRWADEINALLSDDRRYREMSDRGFDHVQTYTHQSAADGVSAALDFALARKQRRAS